jgi:hypothetical protein
MNEIAKLIAHYRKKAIGYRTAAGKAAEKEANPKDGQLAAMVLNMRAAIWEDVAEDLDAWFADKEIPEGVQ